VKSCILLHPQTSGYTVVVVVAVVVVVVIIIIIIIITKRGDYVSMEL
jgi:hypothetical protein